MNEMLYMSQKETKGNNWQYSLISQVNMEGPTIN